MRCRNHNVDGCVANDNQSYKETFSNENSNNSGYLSDHQETPKIYGKNDFPIKIFVQFMLCRSSKSDSFFFLKMSGV